MFEDLKDFKRIVVVGPQFSGTDLCSEMISKELGLRLFTQHDIGWAGNNRQSLSTFNSKLRGDEFVIEVPALTHMAHQFADEDMAVVFVVRSVGDIIEEQMANGWIFENSELYKYPEQYRGLRVAAAKEEFWMTEQKDRIQNAFEVHYSDLVKPKKATKKNAAAKHSDEDVQ